MHLSFLSLVGTRVGRGSGGGDHGLQLQGMQQVWNRAAVCERGLCGPEHSCVSVLFTSVPAPGALSEAESGAVPVPSWTLTEMHPLQPDTGAASD